VIATLSALRFAVPKTDTQTIDATCPLGVYVVRQPAQPSRADTTGRLLAPK
jgi:hypothetical protein